MEINPKLVKGLSGAELHVSAMYHRFSNRFKTCDISNLSKVFEAIKKL